LKRHLNKEKSVTDKNIPKDIKYKGRHSIFVDFKAKKTKGQRQKVKS
jgi:hypothetical protein